MAYSKKIMIWYGNEHIIRGRIHNLTTYCLKKVKKANGYPAGILETKKGKKVYFKDLTTAQRVEVDKVLKRRGYAT